MVFCNSAIKISAQVCSLTWKLYWGKDLLPSFMVLAEFISVCCFLPDSLLRVNVVAKRTGEQGIFLEAGILGEVCVPPWSFWTLARSKKERFDKKECKMGTGIPGMSIFQANHMCEVWHHHLRPQFLCCEMRHLTYLITPGQASSNECWKSRDQSFKWDYRPFFSKTLGKPHRKHTMFYYTFPSAYLLKNFFLYSLRKLP